MPNFVNRVGRCLAGATRLRNVLAMTSVLGTAGACAALAGLEDGANDTYDANPPPAPPTPPAPPDPCSHAKPPSNNLDAGIGEDLPLMTAAVREMTLSPPGTDAIPGYDLDGVCTCEEDPNTAYKGAPSCAGSVKHCDIPKSGIDNSLSTIFSGLPKGAVSAFSINCPYAIGEGGLVYGLSGYNGESDDSAVEVTYYQARQAPLVDGGAFTFPYVGQEQRCLAQLRGEPLPDAGTDAERFVYENDGDAGGAAQGCAKAPPVVPQWNGCDGWNFEPGVLPYLQGVRTLIEPRFAYVRNGVLVIPLAGSYQGVLGDNHLSMTDATITARIELLDARGKKVEFGGSEVRAARAHHVANQPRDRYETDIYDNPVRMRLVDGVIAGRIDPDQIYQLLGTGVVADIPGIPPDEHLCQGSVGRAILAGFRKRFCEARDLAENAQADNRNQACTRVSFAFTFQAVPAFPGKSALQAPAKGVDCDLKVREAAGPDGGYEHWQPLDCADGGAP